MFWLVFLGHNFAILTVILALCHFRTDLAVLILYSHDLRPIIPSAALVLSYLRLLTFRSFWSSFAEMWTSSRNMVCKKIKRQVVNHFFSKLGGLEIFTCSCKINIFSDLNLISVVPLLAEWCVSIHGLMSLFLLCPLMKSWKS